VGGGIAGLTAAYQIRAARPAARVLLLENHPLPGGEAKQNELVVDGVPLDARTKADLLAWRFNATTFAPPDRVALDPWLDSMSYGTFIERVMGLGPAAVALATAITGTTSYAASADAVSAFGAARSRATSSKR
jgi:hypothetical protein